MLQTREWCQERLPRKLVLPGAGVRIREGFAEEVTCEPRPGKWRTDLKKKNRKETNT